MRWGFRLQVFFLTFFLLEKAAGDRKSPLATYLCQVLEYFGGLLGGPIWGFNSHSWSWGSGGRGESEGGNPTLLLEVRSTQDTVFRTVQ